MATNAQNDNLDPSKQPAQPGGSQSQPGSAPATSAGGGGSAIPSGGASGAGAPASGAGGSSSGNSNPGGGGWVNIQNYLGANQGNTGSQDILNKQVGGTFGQEQSNLDSQAKDTKAKADAAAGGYQDISADQEKQMMGNVQKRNSVDDFFTDQSKGIGQFSNSTSGADDQKLKSALNYQYQGPKNFNYNIGNDAKTYGDQMGTDQGFNATMQGLYNKSANGGQMGSGAMALQGQLDSGNQGLQTARQQLLGQYAGLNDNVAKTTADTDAAVKADQSGVLAKQAALKSGLTNDMNTAEGAYKASDQSWHDKGFQGVNSDPQNFRQYQYLHSLLGLGDVATPNAPAQQTQAVVPDQYAATLAAAQAQIAATKQRLGNWG